MSEIHISIRNRREEFAHVAEAIDRLAGEHFIAPDLVADVQIALDEVLANIVDYGYTDDADHDISIWLCVSGDVLEATVEDDGMPFNPLESATPDMSLPLQKRGVGGVGLHFVKNLMDEVTYRRIGERNRLALRKNLVG